MSASPASTPGPRRSQRDKKKPKPFTSGPYLRHLYGVKIHPNFRVTVPSKGKRKRPQESDDDVNDGKASEEEEEDAHDGDADEEGEDYRAPKKPSARKPNANGKSTSKSKPPVKRPRVAKTNLPKPPNATSKRGRKPKGDADAYDAAQVAKDTKITADNPLFSM